MRKTTILYLENTKDSCAAACVPYIVKCIDWLKSLKERVQPKVELTQLDKNILDAAITFVELNNHFNCCRGVDKHTVLSALRSLKPHKQ